MVSVNSWKSSQPVGTRSRCRRRSNSRLTESVTSRHEAVDFQAICRLLPAMIAGAPGRETPTTSCGPSSGSIVDQAHAIPGIGDHQFQVHIVGDDSGPGAGVPAIHHPIVAADLALLRSFRDAIGKVRPIPRRFWQVRAWWEKSEGRNPKAEGSPNSEIRQGQVAVAEGGPSGVEASGPRCLGSVGSHSDKEGSGFGFRPSDFLRVSGFGLRI